ncbi:hypothetical protein NRB15_06850 [Pseudomonas alliivorans]|uniref:hypothetical protein n=1 Tax=Pseudomonas alliivorans TaxID=2810613 RepID=UPI00211D1354|nr:hypothetical protein [Pseudomonas alliivorans]MCQ9470054.1 hypothetical protein [Pseudomonas alliivorans]
MTDKQSSTEPAAPKLPEMNLEKRLRDIYSDKTLTTAEFMALRDDADRLFTQLIEQLPGIGYIGLFQQMADVTVQAMQLGMLDVKRAKPTADVKALLKQSYEFQVAYIKASLDRFTQTL